MLTQQLLDETKLIFNHVPKAGGSSLYFFFQELFGADRVFRFHSRVITDKTKTMEKLTPEERERYKIFQGHFKYGYHTLFSQKCLYIGIMRDPIDRMISNYYYTKTRGREDRKEEIKELSLTDFVDSQMEGKKKGFGAAQANYLTGQTNIPKAKEIIESDYLMCCATDQLDRFQGVMARLYGRPDLAPLRRNVTNSTDQAGDERAALKEKYGDFFLPDRRLLNFVRKRFDEVYDHLSVSEAA